MEAANLCNSLINLSFVDNNGTKHKDLIVDDHTYIPENNRVSGSGSGMKTRNPNPIPKTRFFRVCYPIPDTRNPIFSGIIPEF